MKYHQLQRIRYPAKYNKDIIAPDKAYDDKEEARVVKGREQKVALALGEIKKGQVTRKHHTGFNVTTPGPTSNKYKKMTKKEEQQVVDDIKKMLEETRKWKKSNKMKIKTMKLFSILPLFMISFSLCSHAQDKHDDYILALSVDFNMLTQMRITCDNFATAFKSTLQINEIRNSDSLKMFSSFFQKIKYVKKNREIDVRCKILYESNNVDKIIVCYNGQLISINGRLIKKNKKFGEFINSLVHRTLR